MEKENKRGGRDDRADLKERFCRSLDLLPDAIGKDCVLEIRGRNYVSVREGGGILLYTPEQVKIKIPRGAVSVYGRRLCCTSYSAGAVGIEGYIDRVAFEEV